MARQFIMRTATAPRPLRLLIGWPPADSAELIPHLRPLKQQKLIEWQVVSAESIATQLRRRDQYHVVLTTAKQFATWTLATRQRVSRAISLLLLLPDTLPPQMMPSDFDQMQATIVSASPLNIANAATLIIALCRRLTVGGCTIRQAGEQMRMDAPIWTLMTKDEIWPLSEQHSKTAASDETQAQDFSASKVPFPFDATHINIQNAQFGDRYTMGDVGYFDAASAENFRTPRCASCQKEIQGESRFCKYCGQEV